MSHSFTSRFWVGTTDLRAVGIFRITFGLAMLSSIVDLLPVLRPAFSDEGFWPRSAALAVNVRRFSLMDVSGPPWVTYGYWLVTVLACLFFIVGWHARLATIATFVLASGLMERNLGIFDSSDDVIRVLLFWSIFLPVGCCYSVDAALLRTRGRPLSTEGNALVLRLAGLQIGWIYLCTFLRKLPGDTWHNGTAVHIALGLEHYYTRPIGHLMRLFPWSTAAATYFTVAVEATFLPLAFLPILQPRAKALALLSGFALHAGIWVTMCIGGFSWVMVASYPLLFEPAWVDWTIGRTKSIGRWLEKRLVPQFARERARAVVAVASANPCDTTAGVTSAATRATSGAVGTAAEGGIATTSSSGEGGDRQNPWTLLFPTPLVNALRRALQASLVVLLALCVWSSAPPIAGAPIPERLAAFVQTLEIWQKWAMFAPNPPESDIVLRGAGKLVDGTDVDVLRGDQHAGPLPPPTHDFLASRWTAVSDSIAWGDRTLLLEFGRFVCRHWNGPDRPSGRPMLFTFRLSREERRVSPRGSELGAPHEVVLWDHVCVTTPAAASAPAAASTPAPSGAP